MVIDCNEIAIYQLLLFAMMLISSDDFTKIHPEDTCLIHDLIIPLLQNTTETMIKLLPRTLLFIRFLIHA